MRTSPLKRLSGLLPRGLEIPEASWVARHRAILVILWLHVIAIPVVAVFSRVGLRHGLLEAGMVAALAAGATQKAVPDRRIRAIFAALGLLTSSAVLVHLTGGLVETHFHFFVMIAIITLYQDWSTFATAIVFVALHHGAIGVMHPEEVFDHNAAFNNPWKWAAIHAAFVLAASAAHVTQWKFVEDQYHRAEAAIKRRERRFRSLIENSSDGVSVLSADGAIVYDSPSVVAMLGYELNAREGTSALDYIHPDDKGDAEAMVAGLIETAPGTTVGIELRALHKDGTPRWLEVRATNLLSQPDLTGIVANYRDITDRKVLETELEHQAFHDPLTQLANRALFLDRIEHAQATQKRTGDYLAVLFLDLDDFKTVNDGLGHAAGDSVLIAVAERLLGCLRLGDTCARLGGDEFAVLLEGMTGPGDAYEIGARILEAIAGEIVIDGTKCSLNGSLGIVVSTGDEEPATLVRNADLAMYQAKACGKGRFEVFERGMYDAVVERLELKANLRAGVERGEFVVHYQPIVDLPTEMVVGAEALVRWNHPQRGLLAPIAFIDLAEETGLIVEIGRAVLFQACADAKAWNDAGDACNVNVNLSGRQLQDPSIVADVAQALKDTGLDPALLTLEITESVLIDDPDAASAKLRSLKDLGVQLALDDFGTGYSSLSYLSRFPVDCLKIDKSFVDALAGSGTAGDASLVGAIAGIGDLLRLEVTAEGIEHLGQVDELLALGCRSGQGYYFAKPLPNDAFTGLLGHPFHEVVAAAAALTVPDGWSD